MPKVTFSPQKAMAAICKYVFKAYLIYHGTPADLATLYGEGLGGLIEGINIEQDRETIKNSLSQAINRAWDQVFYNSDIPENCQIALKKELITSENAIFVIGTKNPDETLRTIAVNVLKKHMDWDGAKIYSIARTISDTLMTEVYQEIENNGTLTIVVELDAIKTKLNKIDIAQEENSDLLHLLIEEISSLHRVVNQALTNIDDHKMKQYVKSKNTLLKYSYAQIESIKKQSIFPWVYGSNSLNDVYQDLFVTPVLEDNHTKEDIRDLEPFIHENLMILGEAGSGKSMLLKTLFAFILNVQLDDTICLYFHADSTVMKNSAFKRDFKFAREDVDQHYLFIIDGVDETYLFLPSKYKKFIKRLNEATNCSFWLGSRQDFYKQNLGNKTKISDRDFELQEWNPEQIDHFISGYSKITMNPQLQMRIEHMINESRDGENIRRMMKNPFQLSVLVFLAEQSDELEINSTFDLYDQFVTLWVNREKDRGTCRDKDSVIYDALYEAAVSIYYNNEYILNDTAENNTAISGLLQIEPRQRNGKYIAKVFYHRSLAAFIIANRAYQAMYENDTKLFIKASEARSRDDITNFIGSKFESIDNREKHLLKNNLTNIYRSLPEVDDSSGARQQIIYYITRLGIDVSDFIISVIEEKPSDLYMRLSLAYGCVLSKNKTMRQYALRYAQNIAEDPYCDDAITNRGWTAVYFNDVNIDELKIDPYEYKDTFKGSWENSRKARINRFTHKNPRIKDLRFWILDLPLFHSYLIDRGWDNISIEEYRIIESLKFDSNVFDEDEIEFMKKEQSSLLADYMIHLESEGKDL